jgi:excisionase family DNA binding protein
VEDTHLLTVKEFASPLKLKPSCVRRWIRERKITTIRVGRLIRIPASEIDRVIAQGTRPAKGGRSR